MPSSDPSRKSCFNSTHGELKGMLCPSPLPRASSPDFLPAASQAFCNPEQRKRYSTEDCKEQF